MIPLSYVWDRARDHRAVVFGWRPSIRADCVAVAMFEAMAQAQAFARAVSRAAIIRRCWLSGLWLVSVPVPRVRWLPLVDFGAPSDFRITLAGAC